MAFVRAVSTTQTMCALGEHIMLLSKEPQVLLVPAEMEESTAKLRGLMLFLVLVTKVTTAQEEQSTKITIAHLLEPLELEDIEQKETFDQQDQLL